MGMSRFDDFVDGVRRAVLRAQEALDHRKTEESPNDQSFSCIIRRGETAERLELPRASFRVPNCLRISSFSMTFECVLRRTIPLALAGTGTLVISRAGETGISGIRRKRHGLPGTLRILFTGRVMRVLLEEQLLERMPACPVPFVEAGRTKDAASIPQRIADWLVRVSEPPGFVLTREQSARAVEILRRS